jgi:hypothetical protein
LKRMVRVEQRDASDHVGYKRFSRRQISAL